jgi:hypothetical protein
MPTARIVSIPDLRIVKRFSGRHVLSFDVVPCLVGKVLLSEPLSTLLWKTIKENSLGSALMLNCVQLSNQAEPFFVSFDN